LTRFDRPVYFALGGLSNPDQFGEIATRLSGVFPDSTSRCSISDITLTRRIGSNPSGSRTRSEYSGVAPSVRSQSHSRGLSGEAGRTSLAIRRQRDGGMETAGDLGIDYLLSAVGK
jgi:hypothetical protein